MTQITMNKNEVIATVSNNLKTHEDTYKKAIKGYSETLTDILFGMYNEAHQTGKVEDLYKALRLPKPESHVKDYLNALEMLNNHSENKVTLTQKDYVTLMKDEWDWQVAFKATSTMYNT